MKFTFSSLHLFLDIYSLFIFEKYKKELLNGVQNS